MLDEIVVTAERLYPVTSPFGYTEWCTSEEIARVFIGQKMLYAVVMEAERQRQAGVPPGGHPGGGSSAGDSDAQETTTETDKRELAQWNDWVTDGQALNNPVNENDPLGLSKNYTCYDPRRYISALNQLHQSAREKALKMSLGERLLIGVPLMFGGSVLAESGAAIVFIGAPTGLLNIVTFPVGGIKIFIGVEAMYLGYIFVKTND